MSAVTWPSCPCGPEFHCSTTFTFEELLKLVYSVTFLVPSFHWLSGKGVVSVFVGVGVGVGVTYSRGKLGEKGEGEKGR